MPRVVRVDVAEGREHPLVPPQQDITSQHQPRPAAHVGEQVNRAVLDSQHAVQSFACGVDLEDHAHFLGLAVRVVRFRELHVDAGHAVLPRRQPHLVIG